jgi:transcriptional regulator of met regulon
MGSVYAEIGLINGADRVLLGAIPMEYMDVLTDPRRRRLVVNPEHPYRAQVRLA